ncbi:MAG: NAD-dependent epimerase/dehydratase family protein [Acidobacteriota bacterium]|nr:NAD-dependent epimerase/dehydratase family protein [Acidobacteriota bacterium]
MNIIVTGAAGFIGSRLSLRLLANGCRVTGIDCLTDFYDERIKRRNLEPLLAHRGFRWLNADLNDLPLRRLLRGAEAVYHLAAQAGVRDSWGDSFDIYIRQNIRATQRLLEAAKGLPLRRFIYASSSSVYGLTPDMPFKETSPLHPLSPYGVSKLAAENLAFLYFRCFGVPTVSLRFFTVYGPGQRPDMAFHKFLKAIRGGAPITVFGNGKQTRDFTYVDDIVTANLAALERGRAGEVYNVGGGHRERLDRVFKILESVCGGAVRLRRAEAQKGDAPHTFADISKAGRELGFAPRTGLADGLAAEWDYIRTIYPAPAAGRRAGKGKPS